jgi:hypothetical protein
MDIDVFEDDGDEVGDTLELDTMIEELHRPSCQVCGSELTISGHCATCPCCGFSLCSM